MGLGEWLRAPRRWLLLFLGIMLTLAGVLGWLTLRVAQQERAVEAQQMQERLGSAADLATAALLHELSRTDDLLAELLTTPAGDVASLAARHRVTLTDAALLVALEPVGVSAFPSANLLYYPALPPAPAVAGDAFARGESLEFREKDYMRAAEEYRRLAASPGAALRAGALLRLGRAWRKAGRRDVALEAYRQLAAMDVVLPGGLPASLIAAHARCSLLEEAGRKTELSEESRRLLDDLYGGRWPLTRGAFEFYGAEAVRWSGTSPPAGGPTEKRLLLSAALERFWQEHAQTAGVAGRVTLRTEPGPAFLQWRSAGERSAALIAASEYLERAWLAELAPMLHRHGAQLAVTDDAGGVFLGRADAGGPRKLVRAPAETRLPWTLHVGAVGAGTGDLSGRTRLLLSALLLVALLLVAGSYFIARAVARELEAARLQADFVAAVSHDFRTPLASLRQLSELLSEGRVVSEERRQQYYDTLRRESERLDRLVESILDFSRMEAGAREYRKEALDAAALVRAVAGEFRQEVSGGGYSVEVATNGVAARLHADPEALTRAVWNLLENAVKYSPDHKTVWVETSADDSECRISVRDRGLGIAAEEQGRIFDKFVRASSAKVTGARGTGLGLAMVRYIMAAHGGKVEVESRPGEGSTFILRLPLARG